MVATGPRAAHRLGARARRAPQGTGEPRILARRSPEGDCAGGRPGRLERDPEFRQDDHRAVQCLPPHRPGQGRPGLLGPVIPRPRPPRPAAAAVGGHAGGRRRENTLRHDGRRDGDDQCGPRGDQGHCSGRGPHSVDAPSRAGPGSHARPAQRARDHRQRRGRPAQLHGACQCEHGNDVDRVRAARRVQGRRYVRRR